MLHRSRTIALCIFAAALAVMLAVSCRGNSGEHEHGVDVVVAEEPTPLPEFPLETIAYTVDTEPPVWFTPEPYATLAPGETPDPNATPAPAVTSAPGTTHQATAAPTQEYVPAGYLTTWEKTRLVNFRHRLADDYVPHDLVNARAFFGNSDYSREALVAEMGAAMLCSQVGIDDERAMKNSVAYLQNWIEALNNDNKMIVWAAARAEKAARYIIGGPEAIKTAETAA